MIFIDTTFIQPSQNLSHLTPFFLQIYQFFHRFDVLLIKNLMLVDSKRIWRILLANDFFNDRIRLGSTEESRRIRFLEKGIDCERTKSKLNTAWQNINFIQLITIEIPNLILLNLNLILSPNKNLLMIGCSIKFVFSHVKTSYMVK